MIEASNMEWNDSIFGCSRRCSTPRGTRNFKHCSRYPNASECDINFFLSWSNLKSPNPFDSVIPVTDIWLLMKFSILLNFQWNSVATKWNRLLPSHGLIMISEMLDHITWALMASFMAWSHGQFPPVSLFISAAFIPFLWFRTLDAYSHEICNP